MLILVTYYRNNENALKTRIACLSIWAIDKLEILIYSGGKTEKLSKKKGLDTIAYRVRCQLKHAGRNCSTILLSSCISRE